jgi:hypothetical protein
LVLSVSESPVPRLEPCYVSPLCMNSVTPVCANSVTPFCANSVALLSARDYCERKSESGLFRVVVDVAEMVRWLWRGGCGAVAVMRWLWCHNRE